jgi:hypothetical protein
MSVQTIELNHVVMPAVFRAGIKPAARPFCTAPTFSALATRCRPQSGDDTADFSCQHLTNHGKDTTVADRRKPFLTSIVTF